MTREEEKQAAVDNVGMTSHEELTRELDRLRDLILRVNDALWDNQIYLGHLTRELEIEAEEIEKKQRCDE